MNQQFLTEVLAGLQSTPKTLPSKYFYDAKGDALFVEIMNCPEYYLTDAELDIFTYQTAGIVAELGLQKDVPFDLIELGAGDGTKTFHLLKHLLNKGFSFTYHPVDFSSNALVQLEKSLAEKLPDLEITPEQGDYFSILEGLKKGIKPMIVLFLGSSIGNMKDERAGDFIYRLGESLNPNDKLFLGVDIIKDPAIIAAAYNDAGGITSRFNLNLLDRINQELGGNFAVENFVHAPEYDAENGVALSYLQSLKEQTVSINGTDIPFAKGEKIHTEISCKYNDDILTNIISRTDFRITGRLTDSKGYFTDYVLTRE